MRAEAETRPHPRRSPGMHIPLNLREIRDFDVSLDDLRHGVEMNSELTAGGWELEKTAVLIQNQMDEMMAEVYAGFHRGATAVRNSQSPNDDSPH